VDWKSWQQRWDVQQETYMPDREERFERMLDVVEVAGPPAPRILDLAGGTGSISLRALARFPSASSVIVDVDPALLAIAEGSFAGDRRVQVCRADLAAPSWIEQLGEPPESFDAVLTATALHWLTPERVAQLYRECGRLLRSGGVLENADHMADEGLGRLSDEFAALREVRRAKVRAESGAPDWDGWWAALGEEPSMQDLVEARHRRFAKSDGRSHTHSNGTSGWHVQALVSAGFGQVGLAWRGLDDALVMGVKP
jgi:ubiquinone/menaquinone biosynthesis C-methylase UbiE